MKIKIEKKKKKRNETEITNALKNKDLKTKPNIVQGSWVGHKSLALHSHGRHQNRILRVEERKRGREEKQRFLNLRENVCVCVCVSSIQFPFFYLPLKMEP